MKRNTIIFLYLVLLILIIYTFKQDINFKYKYKYKYDLWNLYPSGISKSFVNLRQPIPFNIKDDWIVFLRIQKTGSKSLKTILNKQITKLKGECPSTLFLSSPSVDNINCTMNSLCSTHIKENKNKLEKCKLFSHHHCDWKDIFSKDDFSIENNTHVFTILRDPIGRVLSEFKHVYKNAENSYTTWDYCQSTEQITKEILTVENFLLFFNQSQNSYGMRNRQTRMLAGCGSEILCKDLYKDEQEMLNTAKKHLLQCSVFGTLGEFNNLIIQINYYLNWKINEYAIVLENRDSVKFEVSPTIMDMILEYNKLDNELYKFAKEVEAYRLKQLKSYYKNNYPIFSCDDNLCILNNK